MTRVMRDSVTPSDIPTAGTQLVAGYANGTYSWDAAGWARFSCPHVLIDVRGSFPAADVLDVEPGDATPAGAVAWVRQKLVLKPDYPPVLYVNRAQRAELESQLRTAGFEGRYRIWLATLDGTKTVSDMTGVCAVQWAGETRTGGHFDESIVYDDTWKKPPPATTLTKTDIANVAAAVVQAMPPAPPPPPPIDVSAIADAAAAKVAAVLAERLKE